MIRRSHTHPHDREPASDPLPQSVTGRHLSSVRVTVVVLQLAMVSVMGLIIGVDVRI